MTAARLTPTIERMAEAHGVCAHELAWQLRRKAVDAAIEACRARAAKQERPKPDGRKKDPLWVELDTEPYDRDPIAQYVVASFPEGLTLTELGELMGVCRERVRQVEAEAFRKLRSSPEGRVLLEQWRKLQRARDEREGCDD